MGAMYTSAAAPNTSPAFIPRYTKNDAARCGDSSGAQSSAHGHIVSSYRNRFAL